MEIGSRSAQRLYGQALDVAKPAGAETTGILGPNAAPTVEGSSFSETVGQLAENTVETLRSGEEAAKAMMAGKADPHSVVEALAQTEMALEMAVTVRDRVVEAYQEILRMPV